ncbi:1-acyl-sn-glycerol-3-phosphate acyltransferase PlsC [Gottschalkia acidurici 9a]|uniref:1-acyl-sn-glycerol-3-phosphate acyltransferase n=1 Tax=Gottschalkia acidurici (strain ATCC 7906 / DSM 604 / BCRC 14475 / CIP 104303 / KCTC 5404 / NCIMB 10678 / 9a) TaxID=1128398 RepID=K0B511_GOTA9|nr:lysophospholipid acyltransferase family protein [Gottschalkia acidurici]AFS79651.1 1-acyl-sn-glycerol-3-phosphate acyltransferase PlsC [Gottschalkia acidurici 9a]
MIRTIIWFIYFWVSLILLTPSLLKVKSLEESGKIEDKDKLVYKKVRNWAISLIKLSGCEVKVIGEENIPKEGNVLFVSNHQGNFDIPILLGYIEKSKGFVAKKELEKLPMVNKWMKAINCVFMDRTNPRESIKAIKDGIEILKRGYSLVIFPEGTRSKDGSLGEFKPGGLKLATKSEVPIVPVTIKGSNKIMEKGSLIIKPAKVEVIISPVVQVDNQSKNDTKELTETVRNIISENINK